MFKLIIVGLALSTTEPVQMGKIMLPWDFADNDACEAFANTGDWKMHTRDGFGFQYECMQVSEGV